MSLLRDLTDEVIAIFGRKWILAECGRHFHPFPASIPRAVLASFGAELPMLWQKLRCSYLRLRLCDLHGSGFILPRLSREPCERSPDEATILLSPKFALAPYGKAIQQHSVEPCRIGCAGQQINVRLPAQRLIHFLRTFRRIRLPKLLKHLFIITIPLPNI